MGCRGLPGCSIIRASLTVALMVSLPSQISAFCALAARSPCICSRLRVALPPLAATAHRADASLRCPKPCAAAQKSERCECPKGTRNAPRSTPPRISAQTARPSSTRRGRAASIQKTLSFGKTRVSRSPSVARNARRALPPEALASSRFFLHQAAFLASLRSLATLDGLCRRKRRRPPLLPASSRVSCSLRSLATLTAFAAAEVFGALPQTPARA